MCFSEIYWLLNNVNDIFDAVKMLLHLFIF
jgi:hypothetical protein